MAVEVEIPGMGESVSEVVLIEWLKGEGEYVERDEAICVLETDKANVDLPSPAAGVLSHLVEVEATLSVGDVIARIDEDGEPGKKEEGAGEEPGKKEAAPESAEKAKEEKLSPAVRRLVEEHELDPEQIEGTGKGGRLLKEDVLAFVEKRAAEREKAPVGEGKEVAREAKEAPAREAKEVPAREAKEVPAREEKPGAEKARAPASGEERVRRVPMSRIRQRIAQHLVSAQRNAAMLTTFNEVDMSGVMELRGKYKERFAEVHGVSLGLMSFFSRAAVQALGEFPEINAFVEGSEIVYHDYVHLGIAVSTDRGLVVPVLRHAQALSMADIESEIKRLALGARDNRLAMDDLSGGTFTITNGGVFGSLLSTPILNAPQSGILGMHAIQQRPVAVDGQVQVRPMMYVALSYDHRIVDGKQSVSFLVRLKQLVEDPARLLLQV